MLLFNCSIQHSHSELYQRISINMHTISLVFASLKIVAFYCSRRNMSCKCYNSYIFWVYILHCFKQHKILLCNFRSTTNGQYKLVPLRERQQKALYVLSLAGSLGRINKKELLLYSLSDKAAEEILISFPIIKGYHVSAY